MAPPKKENQIDLEEVKKLMVFTAIRLQQDFYEILSDWNEYDPQNPHVLKNSIGTALYGPPEFKGNEHCMSSKEDITFFYKESSQMKTIQKIYEKIVEHGTQSTKDKKILCSLMYNVILLKTSVQAAAEKMHKNDDFHGDSLMDYVHPIPFFKVLKNVVEKKKNKGKKKEEKMEVDKEEKDKEKKNEDGEEMDVDEEEKTKFQVYYIDEKARVYKSWSDYLTRNVLPDCLMVVPYGGEYQGEQEEQWTEEKSYVWVESHVSPASKLKILGVCDSANTLIGAASMAIGIAGVFTPIGASIAIAGAVGVGVSSLWTIGRSSHELVDRSQHDQSINVTNKEGFTCWLGLATSTLAVASTGGSFLLSRAIKNGTSIGKVAQYSHDAVQITTLGATTVNAGLSAYNMYENYQETKTVSAQDVLNLTATLLLLGNSVVSMKFTKTLIENQQTSLIKDFETSLRSNRHRKEFQKMVKTTNSVSSDPTKAKEQIIRGINKINNKDEFFSSILRNKKSFASEGVKPAFVEGKVVVNGKTLMNPADFVKGMKTDLNLAKSVPLKPVIVPSTSGTKIQNESIFESALAKFIMRHALELGVFVTTKLMDFVRVLTDISDLDKPDVIFSKLLFLALKIITKVIQDKSTTPGTNLLVSAVEFLWDFIKASMRGTLREVCKEAGPYREVLMKILLNLYNNVENKLDEWVDAFKEYLRMKLREIEDMVKNACSNQEGIGNATRELFFNGSI